jgi:hypothetical protein
MIAEQVESKTAEQDKLVEAEHGPCVFIDGPGDDSRFGFKRLTREVFELRNNRVKRGGDEAVSAEEKMLQERCVFPSREAWNKYVAASVFEPLAYADVYRIAHGGKVVRECDADEVPTDPDPLAVKWLTNGEIVVGFRKPGRAETKMFQAQILAQQNGEKLKSDPVEALLKNCAIGSEFAAWLEDNLFGIGKFSDAFLLAFGMQEARVSGK